MIKQYFFNVDDAVNEEIQDFLSEIETMKHIGHHKNIINMLGTCSTNGKSVENKRIVRV